jgi:hypothetical protein
MRTQFYATIKGIATKMPKPTEDDPHPEPVTTITLEQPALDSAVLGELYRLMRNGEVAIRIATDQASFGVQWNGTKAAFVPDEPTGTDVDPETGELLDQGETSVTLSTQNGDSVTMSAERFRRATEALARQ